MTFPVTYCITCSQTDRTAKARAHFRESNVPARFVQGVHGRTWGIETRLMAHNDPPSGFKIDTGHVGLNLSHWMIWQMALDRGLLALPEVLICEDDAIFCADFRARYAEHRTELPDDWQIWYVGSLGAPPARRATKHLRHLDHRGPHGTHCYLVRNSALPVLLEKCQEARLYIDQNIGTNAMPHLVGYASAPSLVGQHSYDGTWPHVVGGNPEPTDPPEILGFDAELRSLDHVPGWCCPEKRRAIYDAVRGLAKLHDVRGVELGVFGGQSLFPAAMALRDAGRGKIVGIDPWTKAAALESMPLLESDGEPNQHREWWDTKVNYERIKAGCLAELARRRLAPWCEVRVGMPDDIAQEFGGLHYLHLDDSHATDVAVRNVRTWLPKLLPGGVLILDDATWPTVQPARELIAAELELIDADPSEGRRWEIWHRRAVQ